MCHEKRPVILGQDDISSSSTQIYILTCYTGNNLLIEQVSIFFQSYFGKQRDLVEV